MSGRPPARRPPAGRPHPEARRAQRERDAKAARPEGGKLFRVAGVAAVEALAPDAIERLYFEAEHQRRLAPLCARLGEARRPFRLVGREELARVAGTPLNGGVVALIQPPRVADFDVGEAKRWAREGGPLLILDGVGNPHNLGAIVRSAAFFGLKRLVVSDHPGQAGPSEAAWRVAEGGFAQVRIHRAHRLAHVLPRLAPEWLVLGTALGGEARTLAEVSRRQPVALVLGNEEEGLPPETLAACAGRLTLPGSGAVQSLNVAATAAILIHWFAAAR